MDDKLRNAKCSGAVIIVRAGFPSGVVACVKQDSVAAAVCRYDIHEAFQSYSNFHE